MSNPPTSQRAATFPADVDALWGVLTEPSSASEWLGYRVTWELEPGSPARFEDGDDGDRQGRVEEVVPGRLLRFRWWPDGADGDGDAAAGVSEVTYDLEPADEGTRLTVTEERIATDPRERGSVPSDEASGSTSPTGSGPVARAFAGAGVGGSGPMVPTTWVPWDTRLAGVWCVAAAVATVAA